MSFATDTSRSSAGVKQLTPIQRKVDRHLLPVLFWLAIVTSLNGYIIGNARLLGLEHDLHLKKEDFNIAVLVYFVPAILWDVPSNLLMQVSRPPVYLGGFALLSGIITLGMSSVQSYAGLIACRVLLGLCNTGFKAGAIYLLASYYPGLSLHARMSPFQAVVLVGRALGGLIAFATTYMDQVRGLHAWRWLLLFAGCLCTVSAIVAYFLLPQWPEKASFLSDDEKEFLTCAMTRDASERSRAYSRWWLFKKMVQSPIIVFSTVIHFCCTTIAISSSVFLPTILRDLGFKAFQAFALSVPIFALALSVAIVNGFISDRAGRRYLFCVVPLVFVVVAFSILLAHDRVAIGVGYMASYFLVAGTYAAHSTSLTWLNNNIIGRKARGIALGVVGSIGNCGFILGSMIYLPKEAPAYPTGFGTGLALGVVAIMAATLQLRYLVRKNRNHSFEEYPFSGNMY